MRVPCGRSFTVLGVWGDLICFRSVLVFSSAFCFYYYLIIVAIVVIIIIIDYYCYNYFHGASGSL